MFPSYISALEMHVYKKVRLTGGDKWSFDLKFVVLTADVLENQL